MHGDLGTTTPVVGSLIQGEVALPSDTDQVVRDAPDAEPIYALQTRSPAEMVRRAVTVAATARDELSLTSAADRGRWLRAGAENLRAGAADIEQHIIQETGKPIAQAAAEVRAAADILDQFAAEAGTLAGRVLDNRGPLAWGMEMLAPIGVAALITSWNFPLQGPALKVGAALAAGCPAVLKPSPLACLTALDLVTALHKGGCPTGALGLLPGGAQTARDLVAQPEVAVVSATGSTTAGTEIMRVAATPPRRCVMELGGKTAQVVFDDADLDLVVPALVSGIIRNQGATCTAGSRLLVSEAVFDEVRGRLLSALAEIRVGDPYDRSTGMGAIRVPGHAEVLLDSISGAVATGAELLTGGHRVTVPGRNGDYLAPTVLQMRRPGGPVWNDELFGPIAVLSRFGSDDEALRLAADSRYGLAVGLWSRDLGRLERAWSRLDVGTIYCNSFGRRDTIPLAASGRGISGYGNEHGTHGVREFLAVKSVHFPRAPREPLLSPASPGSGEAISR